jgi:hypothetical protein
MYISTKSCTKERSKFFHTFSCYGGYDSPILSSMHTQIVTIIPDKTCKVTLYGIQSGMFCFLKDIDGKRASAYFQMCECDCNPCVNYARKRTVSFTVNCKIFAISTDIDCKVKVFITAVEYQSDNHVVFLYDYHCDRTSGQRVKTSAI